MSFRSDLPRKFLVNAFKNQQEKVMRDKYRKKGVLTKIFATNENKSRVLVDILRESDSFNTLNTYKQMSSSSSSKPETTTTKTSTSNNKSDPNEEYLKKYRSTNVGKRDII